MLDFRVMNVKLRMKTTEIDIFALPIVTMVFCVAADYVIQVDFFGSKTIQYILDNITHGAIALLIVLPYGLGTKPTSLGIPLLGAVVAMLLDVDHFLSATGGRSGAHSLTVAFLLALIVYLSQHRFRPAWVVFLALSSHVIRDAAFGGVSLFYPAPSKIIVPYALYLLIILTLQQAVFYERKRTLSLSSNP